MKKLVLAVFAVLVLALAGIQCSSSDSGHGKPSLDGGALDGASLDSTVPKDKTPPTFQGVLTATDVDETHVALTWKPATDNDTPQGAIAYRVYAGTAAGAEDFSQPLTTTPSGATGATLEGLHAATTYFFVVRAVDQNGNEDTNKVEASATTTDTTAPVFGGAKTATAIDRDKIVVTWAPATDNGSAASAITYAVFVSTVQGGEDFTSPAITSDPGATQVTVTGLQEATTYFLVVRAVDAAGNSDKNRHELFAKTLDKTPPVFAGATSATPHGTVITVNWTAAADNVDPSSYLVYNVYFATAPGKEDFSTPSFVSVSGATSQTVTKLAVSTTYYFVVRAVDTSGNEDTNTVEVSATTAASPDVTPPVFAGATSASGQSDTSVYVSWAPATDDYTAQTDIVYDVYVASSAGGETFTAPSYTTDPGATSFTIGNLLPLQTVYVVVRARDQAGNEDTNKVEKSAASIADKVPPTFSGLTSATATGPTSIVLQWSPATDDVSPSTAITYRIYQASASGMEGVTPVATTTAGATSIVISGLSPSTTYYFTARAVDAAGNPDASNPPIEKSVATQADVTPPTFTGVSSLVSTSPTSLTASWALATDDVSPAGGIVYLAYISTQSGQELSQTPVVTSGGATSVTFNGLQPSTTYYVIVRAQDQAGNVDTNTAEKSFATQADVTAPVFAGAASVSGATVSQLTVNWAAASDNVTPASSIRYLVCVSTTNGGCGGSFSVSRTVTGGVSTTFTGLTVNTTYYFVVRAEDAVPNVDGNSVQVSGATLADTTAPTFSNENLQASAASDSSILLTWNAATDDVNSASQLVYDIFEGATSGGEATSPVATTAAGATTYTVGGLQPKTAYYFYVRARDQAGNEDATNHVEATATTQDDKTPPTFGGATSVSMATSLTQLTVNWTAATDDISPSSAIVYEVCWATDTSCSTAFTADATTSAGAANYTITGLLAGTTYNVVVRAMDQAKNVDTNTRVQSGTTLQDTTPPSFGSGVPTISATTASTITLSWPLATDNYSPQSSLRYLVCETTLSNGCGGAGGGFVATTTLTNATTTTFTGLTPKTTYYFVVRAEDQVNNVDTNYNIVSGLTITDTTPPTVSGACSAAPVAGASGDGNITISWAAASDPNFTSGQLLYDVYQATASGGEAASTSSPTYSTVTAGATTITVPQTTPALLSQTAYFFVVRARNPAGLRSTNAATTECTATTITDGVKPTFAGITGLTPIADYGFQATWSAPAIDDTTPTSQIRYEVCWNLHGAASPCTTSFVAKQTTAAGATSYSNVASDGLTAQLSYDFVVRAVDTTGNVDTNTAVRTATTLNDTTAPTFGGATSVTNATLNTLQVNWAAATDDEQDAIVYDVCATTVSGGCTTFSTAAPGASGVSGTSFTATGLSNNKQYFFVVRARDAWGNEAANTTQVTNTTVADTTPPTFSGLQAGAVASATSTTLTVNWGQATDNQPGTITFRVYEAQGSAPTVFTSPVSTQAQTSSNTFTMTGLTPNTTYCFIVRATDASTNTETNTSSQCGKTSAPSIVVSPLTITPSYTGFSVSWSATVTPSASPTYTLCYSTVSGQCPSAGTIVSEGTATNTTAPAVALLPSKVARTYYFVVSATAFGSTVSGAETPASTLADTSPPPTPQTFQATWVALYPSSLGLSWVIPTVGGTQPQLDNVTPNNLLSYNVCIGGVGTSCTSAAFTVTGNGTNPPLTATFYGTQGSTQGGALTSNTSYVVGIQAVDQAGNASGWTHANGTTAVSYTNDVVQIFNGGPQIAGRTSCNATCHTGSGLPGPWTRDYLMSHTPQFCGPATVYINAPNPPNGNPGDPSTSLLYQMIAGTSTTCGPMPETPDGTAQAKTANIYTTDLNTIGAWITQGALAN